MTNRDREMRVCKKGQWVVFVFVLYTKMNNRLKNTTRMTYLLFEFRSTKNDMCVRVCACLSVLESSIALYSLNVQARM